MLSPGTRLGPYEIVAPLGAGGMGEVYRATDTQLKRSVAIKVLPASVAGDADRLARFQREAEVLAALNHPNIAAVFGLEKTPDLTALVMELVEGEDLSALIAGSGALERQGALRTGGLPLTEALPIAKQIAEALEAAHEQGIVHRDLKPANIKVRADGTVKVLDFGLAKALDPHVGRSGVQAADLGRSSSARPTYDDGPTMTSPAMTAMGVILGTAAYMSPEQAKGRAVDRRADIWAFGVVLYEMLTGRRTFEGEDVSDLLVAVLSKDVDLSALPATTPPRITRLIARCLDRNLKTRLQHIGEARIAVDEAAGDESLPAHGGAGGAPLPWRHPFVWLLVTTAAVAAFAVASWAPWRRPALAAPAAAVRFSVAPADGVSAPMGIAVSPDGRRVAFVAMGDDDTARLWVRDLGAVDARALPDTNGAMLPFWSPDGAVLGFFADGWMKKVSMSGGTVTTISEAPEPAGAAWGSDDMIVFAPALNGELFRVPATGGTPTRLTSLDRSIEETSHRAPALLPDGRHVLYLERRGFTDEASLVVAPLDDPDRATVLVPASARPSNAVYAPSGHLLYLREQTLVAQAFDLAGLTLSGDPVPVADAVGFVPRRALIGLFSVSSAEVLAYGSHDASNLQMVWVDRGGRVVSRMGPAVGSGMRYAHLSPDGTRLAFQQTTLGNSDIWTVDLERGASSRLTSDPSFESSPVWSPDGTRVAYHSDREGGRIVARSLSAVGEETLLLGPGTALMPFDWSADGRYLLCSVVDPVTTADIYVLDLQGDHTAVPLLRTPATEIGARLSPDGKWIAYTSDESGRWEVYVDSFPTLGRKTQVSVDGGQHAQWRRDGREIVFASIDGRMWAIGMEAGSPLGRPMPLFSNASTSNSGGGFTWPLLGVTPDGQRLLVYRNAGESNADPLTVVMNWTSVLSE